MLLYLTKRAVFTRWKVLERGFYFEFFILGYCQENGLYKGFVRNISGIVTDHDKVYS